MMAIDMSHYTVDATMPPVEAPDDEFISTVRDRVEIPYFKMLRVLPLKPGHNLSIRIDPESRTAEFNYSVDGCSRTVTRPAIVEAELTADGFDNVFMRRMTTFLIDANAEFLTAVG